MMTSPLSEALFLEGEARAPAPGASAARVGRAFTLVELLVVIMIIGLLLGLLLPAITKAQRASEISRAKADFQAISMALEAYKSDFNVYPMSTPGGQGQPHRLAPALIGPGDLKEDGFDGPGFRAVPGGKVYRPYLAPEKFRVQRVNNQWELIDLFDQYIRYYPRRPPCGANGYAGLVGNVTGTVAYEFHQYDGDLRPEVLRALLGDKNQSNVIEVPGEAILFSGPYILASPGPEAFPTSPAEIRRGRNIYNADW